MNDAYYNQGRDMLDMLGDLQVMQLEDEYFKNKTKSMSLKNISAIDINTHEGRLLLAALAKISTESQTDKEPDTILGQVQELSDKMFKDATPIPDDEQPKERLPFKMELQSLLNRYSKESGSNTPDYILAEFLSNVLDAYDKTVSTRDQWFGVDVWANDKKVKQ